MARYGCIVLIFLFGCIAVVTKLSITTIIEAKAWNERATKELEETVPLAPERGSILSSNGNILACNQTLYDIRMDVRHPKLNKLDKEKWASLDSLADSLDIYYPRHESMVDNPDPNSEHSWHTLLHTQLALPQGKRRKPVRIGRKCPIHEYERIMTWPFLKDIKGKGPVYHEDHVVRVYPFGDMARLSIGRVYEDSLTHRIKGYAGLEMALDSLLYGKPGRAKKVAMNSGLANWVDVAPVRGYDILTTIDIDIQDIVEEELLTMCDSVGAEWGTAIIMEVATGEIKAISNVERDKTTGKYVEAMNRAVQAFEPGSVMKPISLMVAFEDGIVNSVNDMADCSPFMGTADHAGGGMKSMKQIIETSSNPGIARVIFRKYRNEPDKFRDRLATIGFFDKMNSGIGGETTPRVPRLLPTYPDGRHRSLEGRQMDLARQAYGYNTEIPPLYTLSYYNAIANDGKYVRPHLVRALRDEQGRDSILPITYIRDSICSPATARKVKECLHEVVWGKRGTARRLQDDRVEVCGKTGTAYPYDYEVLKSYDKSKRRYAFAGFFPYDQPKYSCMVLITAPAGATSAARASGTVLLNVALKLYARGLLTEHSTYSVTGDNSPAQLYSSTSNAHTKVASSLGLKNAKQLITKKVTPGTVPDVSGLDVASAVKALESAGLNVSYIRGAGFVSAQTPVAGSKIKKGEKAYLTLSWQQSPKNQ